MRFCHLIKKFNQSVVKNQPGISLKITQKIHGYISDALSSYLNKKDSNNLWIKLLMELNWSIFYIWQNSTDELISREFNQEDD